MSGIAVQHADDVYSRRGNFGGFPIGRMVLIYSPEGSNIYGSRGEEFGGIRWGKLKVVKSCLWSTFCLLVLLFKHICCEYRLAMHRQTDRR